MLVHDAKGKEIILDFTLILYSIISFSVLFTTGKVTKISFFIEIKVYLIYKIVKLEAILISFANTLRIIII